MVLVKNLRFILLFVYGKIRPKKVLCDLLDKKKLAFLVFLDRIKTSI